MAAFNKGQFNQNDTAAVRVPLSNVVFLPFSPLSTCIMKYMYMQYVWNFARPSYFMIFDWLSDWLIVSDIIVIY